MPLGQLTFYRILVILWTLAPTKLWQFPWPIHILFEWHILVHPLSEAHKPTTKLPLYGTNSCGSEVWKLFDKTLSIVGTFLLPALNLATSCDKRCNDASLLLAAASLFLSFISSRVLLHEQTLVSKTSCEVTHLCTWKWLNGCTCSLLWEHFHRANNQFSWVTSLSLCSLLAMMVYF